jgi:phage tail-like protein
MPTTSPGEVKDVELVGSWFSVELENGIEGHFSEVGGLNVDVEVVEVTDAKSDTVTRKRPGTTTYNDITLKRTLSPDKSFWDWVKKIRDGNLDYRTNGSIVIHNMAGDEVARWNMTNVWPSKWSASDLDVGSDDLMQEDVTLQVELLEKVS